MKSTIFVVIFLVLAYLYLSFLYYLHIGANQKLVTCGSNLITSEKTSEYRSTQYPTEKKM